MCGGPPRQVKSAADSQLALNQQLTDMFKEFQGKTTPFYENILSQGLPYFNAQSQYSTSDLGRQIDQAKANLAGREAGFGGALPSGFAEQSQRDLGAQGAEAFDQNQMNLLNQNFMAKMAAAQALNPLAPAALSTQGAGEVMQAPLQNTFWSNLLGGIVGGLGQAFQGAGAAAIAGCWIAEVLYGPRDIRTKTLRAWMARGPQTAAWRLFRWFYMKFGEFVAERARISWRLRAALRPLFDLAWRTAEGAL